MNWPTRLDALCEALSTASGQAPEAIMERISPWIEAMPEALRSSWTSIIPVEEYKSLVQEWSAEAPAILSKATPPLPPSDN
jgi:hypothetical protein